MTKAILHISLEIPSQNATGVGRDWRVRARNIKKLRTLWCSWGRFAMRDAGLPLATGPRSMHVIAYRKMRCADIANLIGGFKACCDGLVDAGILIDDRDSKARITYEQNVASKSPTKTPHTVLVIEDIKE